jgi:hypothetical protein
VSSIQRGRGRLRCRQCGGRVEFETDGFGRIVEVCAQYCHPRVLSPEEAGALRDALDRWAAEINAHAARTDAERLRVALHDERLLRRHMHQTRDELRRHVHQTRRELTRYADSRGREIPTSPAGWELLRRDRERDAARNARGGRKRVPNDAQDQYDAIRPDFGRRRGARMAACRDLADLWRVTPQAVWQATHETPGWEWPPK